VLHRVGAQMSAHRLQQDCALVAVLVRHVHLDELVALEAHIDLVQHRFGQALVPDHHHRMQGMGACLERFALDRGEFNIHWVLQDACP
jgi:hypothetical protein